MCIEKPKSVLLPEQNSLCSQPNSGCRYVDVKTGKKSWEKGLAVLIKEDGEPEAKLFIYTYFLKGIGAGKPLIGQIYSLTKSKKLKAKKGSDGAIIFKIETEKRLKLVFKINGKDSGPWVAAIMSGSLHLISHETHSIADNENSKSISIKKSDVKESSINSVTDGSSKSMKKTDTVSPRLPSSEEQVKASPIQKSDEEVVEENENFSID